MTKAKNFDLEKWKKENEIKLNVLEQDIKNLAQNFSNDPIKIAEFLQFKTNFHNYSIRNAALIQLQAPHSTFVASFKDWKDKETSVLKGQKGIQVLVPAPTTMYLNQDGKYERLSDADEATRKLIAEGKLETRSIMHYKIGNVFDIAQTDFPKENYPRLYDIGQKSETHAELYECLKAYTQKAINCSVEEKDVGSISLRGKFSPIENKIFISDKLNDTEKLSVLTHELGHAVMHKEIANLDTPASIIEFEADCFSILMQSQMGIELTDNRKSHLASHFHNIKDIETVDIMKTLQVANDVFMNFNNGFRAEKEITISGEKSVENHIGDDEQPTEKEKSIPPLTEPLEVSIRTVPYRKENFENIKGFATLTINNSFCVKNIKIIGSQNGNFVVMPSYKNIDGNFKSIAFPNTKEAQEELNNKILTEFDNPTNKTVNAKLNSTESDLAVDIALTNGNQAIKGIATITISEVFIVKRVAVVEGSNGLFVQMPSYKKANGEFEDIAFPITKEFRSKLHDAVLNKYHDVYERNNVKTMAEWQNEIEKRKTDKEAAAVEAAMEKQLKEIKER